jgi:signal transduction histidine kinase
MTRLRRASKLAGMGLAPRLLVNSLLVVVAGAGTVLVMALLIAPAVFQAHLEGVEPAPDPHALQHIARAFDESILLALGVGVLIAGMTAAAISWLAARRLAAPVADAADAAGALADGNLGARVADPQMGPEFVKLSTSVNALADRLQATEATRRELTAELAHQLRTPIASIRATVEAVHEGVLPVDEETLETLGSQSARLSRLVDDLEVVSRAEERQLLLAPEPVAIAELVEVGMAGSREAYRAAGVILEASTDAATPDVSVDPDRIQEVLGNLLDNALRHTPAGGSVTISAHPGAEGSRKVAIVEVRDSGDGFRSADSERIFARFAKAPDSVGSGLGLTIARAITEAHHGTLTAVSEGPGQGARFILTLPAGPMRAGRPPTSKG